jgi:hypothetical protein
MWLFIDFATNASWDGALKARLAGIAKHLLGNVLRRRRVPAHLSQCRRIDQVNVPLDQRTEGRLGPIGHVAAE